MLGEFTFLFSDRVRGFLGVESPAGVAAPAEGDVRSKVPAGIFRFQPQAEMSPRQRVPARPQRHTDARAVINASACIYTSTGCTRAARAWHPRIPSVWPMSARLTGREAAVSCGCALPLAPDGQEALLKPAPLTAQTERFIQKTLHVIIWQHFSKYQK